MTPSFFWYLAIMAATTYLVRMLPMVLFRKRIRSRFARSFFYYIPYAVLAAMTLPAILYSTDGYLSAIAGLAVAVLLSLLNRSLIVVSLAACAAALLVSFF